MISIVIPVHNADRFLCQTIDSVIEQTYTDWELIPVDDLSCDNSRNILEEYSHKDNRIHPVYLTKNCGAAIARNQGIDASTGKYIAFLDADDVWEKEKLDRELLFLESQNAAFVFTSYEFADENAVGTGRIVHVPSTLNYKQALKNTTIFTSTVMIDTTKVDRSLFHMPNVKSEDSATWWQILRSGIVAHGLDQNLVYYRRSRSTLSSNKVEAVKRIWFLYRKVEKLNLLYSCYNFVGYAIRAVLRRV